MRSTASRIGALMALVLPSVNAISIAQSPSPHPPAAVPADVAALVGRLKGDDPADRAQAAAGLARLGPRALPALPSLLELFSDQSSLWRSEGARQVHTSVRGEALAAIMSIGRQAVPKLLTMVDDLTRPAGLRAFAAAALGKLHDSRAVPSLISSLNDASVEVVGAGAEALGDIGDRRAVDPLIPLITDKNHSIAGAASTALGKLGDPRAIEPLISAMRVWNERHWGGLAWDLKHFPQDPRVVPALVDQLRRGGDVMAAADVLGELRSAAGVDALIPHLNSTAQPVRCSVAKAFGLIKDRRAVVPLINALRSEKDENARALELEALQSITGQRLGRDPAKWQEWWGVHKRQQ